MWIAIVFELGIPCLIVIGVLFEAISTRYKENKLKKETIRRQQLEIQVKKSVEHLPYAKNKVEDISLYT